MQPAPVLFTTTYSIWKKAETINNTMERNLPSEPGAAGVWGGVGTGGGSSLALPPGWRAAVKPLLPSGPRAILTAWFPLLLALPCNPSMCMHIYTVAYVYAYIRTQQLQGQ